MLLPEASRRLEDKDAAKHIQDVPHIDFEAEDDLSPEDINARRSPGQMLDDDGSAVKARENQDKPNKLLKVTAGAYVAYKSSRSKICHCGKVTNVSIAESNVTLHKYYPVADARMRIHWTAVYTQEGKEVLGQGDKPSLEMVPIKLIIRVLQLHDGVMSHC